MTNLYIVSFAPDYTGEGSIGGFEWRYKREDAVEWLCGLARCGNANEPYDYMLRTVRVPSLGFALEDRSEARQQAITSYLDERPDLWDVPSLGEPAIRLRIA